MEVAILILSILNVLIAIVAIVTTVVIRKMESESMFVEIKRIYSESYQDIKQWAVFDVIVNNTSKNTPFTITGFYLDNLYGMENIKSKLSKSSLCDSPFPTRIVVPQDSVRYTLYFALPERFSNPTHTELCCVTTRKRFCNVLVYVPEWLGTSEL